jgi:hypothetical protein
MKSLVAAIGLTLVSTFAAAQMGGEERPRFILGLGVTGGGATLARVTYTNGDSQNISAGGLVMFYGGVEAPIGSLVSLQVTAGYHLDDTNASNGRVRFSRYPIDVLAIFPASDKLRFGAGAQFVTNPRLKGSGVASGVDQKYDSTVGLVIEGEYRFAPWFGLKLRGVAEKFKESDTGNSVSGNHGGLLASFYF